MTEGPKGTGERRRPAKKSDLGVRFASGTVYFVLTVGLILAGTVTTLVYFCVVAGLVSYEFFGLLRHDAKRPNDLLGIVAAVLYPPVMWLYGFVGVGVLSTSLILALLIWYVFYFRSRVVDVGASIFVALYAGFLPCGFLLVREAVPGFWGGILVLGIMCGVWLNDVFAYLIGRRFGKHKLAPRVSPKKTWEGFIAGMVASVGVWCAIALIPPVDMGFVEASAFGVLCGLAGILGDLAESRFKRNSGVKDSGTIMPGHGGMMDRVDSMIAVSFVSAFLLFGGGCIPYVL